MLEAFIEFLVVLLSALKKIWTHFVFQYKVINPFYVIVPYLYLRKNSGNNRLSDVFRGTEMDHFHEKGLIRVCRQTWLKIFEM